MSKPNIQLQTLFILNDEGRIISTREPGTDNPCPLFSLIRGWENCVWAVRADVSQELADTFASLAQQEFPVMNMEVAPINADRYLALVEGQITSGPAFTFPDIIANSTDVVPVDDLRLLERHFRGWSEAEITERAPLLAILEDGHAVSICFCARLSDTTAEAGLETAEAFRGRGFGPKVTTAWATATRSSGRTPLYSTSWDNVASLAVARKLGLTMYASDWSLYGSPCQLRT
jgi:hypothetical protein